jgi:hypothetical protein
MHIERSFFEAKIRSSGSSSNIAFNGPDWMLSFKLKSLFRSKKESGVSYKFG